MSRSGYNDCGSKWQLILWRGAVASAIRGKRAQAFLKEMLEALDNLPEKKLIFGEEGEVCANVTDSEKIATVFGISEALVREIEWINDEAMIGWPSPERRYEFVRNWVIKQIKEQA